MRKAIICDIILVLLIVLEVLLVLVFPQQKVTDQPLNSTLHFAVSFLFGIVVLVKFYNRTELKGREKLRGKTKYSIYLLMAAAFFLLNNTTINIIKSFDYRHFSDIIPAVEILTRRLLSGQNPYDQNAMEPLLYHGPSNYLSMHWLPYSIAEYFHFDYRTITFSIWCAGAMFIMIRSTRSCTFLHSLIALVLLSGTYMLIASQSDFIIGATIETMVAGYYMLFIGGLNSKNSFLAGLFIAVCLLSRYYVALWLPLWFFVLFVSGNRKQLTMTILSVIFFLLILYIIPFLSKDWSVPYSSFKNYENLPFHEWLNACTNCKPGHLYNGTGFAYLFYERYLHTDLFTGYKLMKKAFYCAVFLSLFFLALWYWFKKKKINYTIFLLASFKIYLSVFLSFILIPYLYLMITGIFVSVAIFAEQASYKTEPRLKQ
jgi:hypothetical protein